MPLTAKTKVRVGISDAKISKNRNDELVTYSLGSCIGVCLYDHTSHIGAMLHYLLPSSNMDTGQRTENPFKYCNTGMNALLEKLESMGVRKSRLKVKLAGGAKSFTVSNNFDIGKRNYMAIRKFLWQNRMFIDAEDVGGSMPRTLKMNVADGSVVIHSKGTQKPL